MWVVYFSSRHRHHRVCWDSTRSLFTTTPEWAMMMEILYTHNVKNFNSQNARHTREPWMKIDKNLFYVEMEKIRQKSLALLINNRLFLHNRAQENSFTIPTVCVGWMMTDDSLYLYIKYSTNCVISYRHTVCDEIFVNVCFSQSTTNKNSLRISQLEIFQLREIP